jgi:hypothetical protein
MRFHNHTNSTIYVCLFVFLLAPKPLQLTSSYISTDNVWCLFVRILFEESHISNNGNCCVSSDEIKVSGRTKHYLPFLLQTIHLYNKMLEIRVGYDRDLHFLSKWHFTPTSDTSTVISLPCILRLIFDCYCWYGGCNKVR